MIRVTPQRRRVFLAVASSIAVTAVGSGTASRGEDSPATHNMLVVGETTVFLSHLPMFDGVNRGGTDFTSPHRYQVVLEATFTRDGNDLSGVYAADRKAHPGLKMYTLNPEEFVLSRLFTPATRPASSTFSATVFRGHLERGGQVISGLKGTGVTVKRVVHAHKFDPQGEKPKKLTYFLFGKGRELFLAHLITGPPDFDQIVSVQVDGHEFGDEELGRGVLVTLDQDNTAAARAREGQPLSAHFQVAGAVDGAGRPLPFDAKFRVTREFYFEEGELLVPPTFDQTPEEKKSGF